MNRFARIAAGILIVAGITAVIAWLSGGRVGTTIAWADVQETIRNARTVAFKLRFYEEGTPEMEMKTMFIYPGRMRQEMMKPEKGVIIMDMSNGQMLCLLEKEKKAMRIDLSGLPEKTRKRHEDKNFLARMKELIEESETQLGEKEIAGRKAKGYRVEKGGQVMTIWADASSGLPLEMEMKPFGEMSIHMYEFEFDKELDEELFSLEVPDGYTLIEQTMELKEASREDAAEAALAGDLAVLRNAVDLFAAEHTGAFPTVAEFADQLTTYTDDPGNTSASKDATFKYGPYLRKVPPLPTGNYKGKTGVAAPAAVPPVNEVSSGSPGWLYDVNTGQIWANDQDNFDK